MKVVIFGATGKTGIKVVEQAINSGHEVTAMVRDAARLNSFSSKIKVLIGDFNSLEIVKSAITGQDAVICVIGTKDLYKFTGLRTMATQTIIKAMKDEGVKRLVVMSAMGVGDSWNSLSFINKAIFALLMPATRKDHESQEALVKASTLDWTIVRASGLIDEQTTSSYQVGEGIRGKISRISRSNVANFILKSIEDSNYIFKAVTITN